MMGQVVKLVRVLVMMPVSQRGRRNSTCFIHHRLICTSHCWTGISSEARVFGHKPPRTPSAGWGHLRPKFFLHGKARVEFQIKVLFLYFIQYLLRNLSSFHSLCNNFYMNLVLDGFHNKTMYVIDS